MQHGGCLDRRFVHRLTNHYGSRVSSPINIVSNCALYLNISSTLKSTSIFIFHVLVFSVPLSLHTLHHYQAHEYLPQHFKHEEI